MKKMTTSKAKFFANQILNLEEKLASDQVTSTLEKQEIEKKIASMVDSICEDYGPTAIYRIDEEVYSLERKRKKQES